MANKTGLNRSMKYVVEVASADDVDRDDKTYPSDAWTPVASGNTYDEVLSFLIIALNDEEIPIDNNWLRLAVDRFDHIEIRNY